MAKKEYTFDEICRDIKAKHFAPIYVLMGEEPFFIDKITDLLLENVLEESESYFKKVNIRILQCDDQVRSDVRIENRQQLQDYMEHFVIRGMGGTDFRPVFEHVAALTRQGAFTKLKGLLYFTDGKGIYPLKKPPYDTAFVFLKDQYEDESVPPWAIKLVLDAEDMEQIADRREEPHEY